MSSVRRACDACHRRKVRCDGKRPCRHCAQASLICTFNAIPKKKGPKGNQARVITEIREAQQRAYLAVKLWDGCDGVCGRSSWAPTPGLLSPDMVDGCINFFFEHIYPTMPILHRERFYQTHVRDMHISLESYCLVCSLCAFMMIQPGMKFPGVWTSGTEVVQDGTPMGCALVEEVLRVRKGYDYVESSSMAAVITSFFLFGSHFCLDKHKVAWFYIREATTLAQTLDMHDESTYHTGDMIECTRRRRLYWLLFLTERYGLFDVFREKSCLKVMIGHMHCSDITHSRCPTVSRCPLSTKIPVRGSRCRASSIWSIYSNPLMRSLLDYGIRLGQIAPQHG